MYNNALITYLAYVWQFDNFVIKSDVWGDFITNTFNTSSWENITLASVRRDFLQACILYSYFDKPLS